MSNAGELRRVALEALAATKAVVIDLGKAAFVDSSVINVLVGLRAVALEAGKAVLIQLGTEAIVRRALEATGILERMTVVKSDDEAVSVI
jgi:anti-anti-sigma factor